MSDLKTWRRRYNGSSSVLERLQSGYVPEPNSGCWLWIGAICPTKKNQSDIRPVMNVAGKKQRVYRVAYELFVGPIPPGLAVCHRCDVSLCINPAHLFLGSNGDNVRDAKKKGRLAVGSKNGSAKLSAEQVRDIRSDNRFHRIIAVDYGVSVRSIERIKARKMWTHIP